MPLDRRELLLAGAALAFSAPRAVADQGAWPPGRATEADAAARLSGPALRRLDDAVRGRVSAPGRRSYAAARQVFQRAIPTPHPRAVVRVRDTRDVQALVRWAAREDVRLVARSGGHSYIGQSGGSGAVVCDLGALRSVRLDRRRGEVEIGGGARLFDVVTALAPHGVLVPSGSCPTVGIGGVTLGGGMGLSARALGLTCDRLVAATIVTADGRRRRVRAGDDLHWALRGGGGSFGIVTSLRLRAAHRPQAAWATVSIPYEQADETLREWLAHAPDWPDEITSILSLSSGSVRVLNQSFGSEAALRRRLEPFGGQISSGTDGVLGLARRWGGCLQSDCTVPGGGDSFAATSIFMQGRLGADGRQALLERIDGGPGALLFDAYGGRIAAGGGAFAHRHARASVQILRYHGPGGSPDADRWVRGTRAVLARHGGEGAYANYPDRGLRNYHRAYWGRNAARLRVIKREVDPDDRFRFAQSV